VVLVREWTVDRSKREQLTPEEDTMLHDGRAEGLYSSSVWSPPISPQARVAIDHGKIHARER
jgi:hypothetical protein